MPDSGDSTRTVWIKRGRGEGEVRMSDVMRDIQDATKGKNILWQAGRQAGRGGSHLILLPYLPLRKLAPGPQ